MRGEIWTMRDDAYASKARPIVIVQSDEVGGFDSVVLCLLTSYDSSDILRRACASSRPTVTDWSVRAGL